MYTLSLQIYFPNVFLIVLSINTMGISMLDSLLVGINSVECIFGQLSRRESMCDLMIDEVQTGYYSKKL